MYRCNIACLFILLLKDIQVVSGFWQVQWKPIDSENYLIMLPEEGKGKQIWKCLNDTALGSWSAFLPKNRLGRHIPQSSGRLSRRLECWALECCSVCGDHCSCCHLGALLRAFLVPKPSAPLLGAFVREDISGRVMVLSTHQELVTGTSHPVPPPQIPNQDRMLLTGSEGASEVRPAQSDWVFVCLTLKSWG